MSKLNDHPLSLVDGALVIDKDLFDVTGIKKFFKVVINTDEDDFLSYPHSTSVRLLDKDDNIVYYELDHLELVTDEQIELEKKEVTDVDVKLEDVDMVINEVLGKIKVEKADVL